MQFILRTLEPLYKNFISFERAHELTKFAIVGVTGLVVNLGVNYILHGFMWYLWASIIAFICTWFTSFTLQKLWTFKNRTMERVHIQAGIAILAASGNLLLNAALMFVAVSILGIFYLYAQTGITLCIAVESYLIYKYVIFGTMQNDVQKPA